jgi:hypothetical protein
VQTEVENENKTENAEEVIRILRNLGHHFLLIEVVEVGYDHQHLEHSIPFLTISCGSMRLTGKITPSREARELVMRVLRSNSEGLTTREVLRRAYEIRPPPTIPAGSGAGDAEVEHPIQSMRCVIMATPVEVHEYVLIPV